MAIMEDAGNAIEGIASSTNAPESKVVDAERRNTSSEEDQKTNNYSRRKRKGDFPDSSMHHGSNKRRRDDFGDTKRYGKGDKGRGQYLYVKRVDANLS